jgi:predicted ATPase
MQKGCILVVYFCIMNRIELSNFRVFAEHTAFDLAPITILTGKNNSGKSSLIKSFILLSDYLSSEYDHSELDLKGKSANKHKINNFGNLRNWNDEFVDEYDELSVVEFFYQKECFKIELTFEGEPEDTFMSLLSLKVTNLEIGRDLSLKRLKGAYGDFELSVSQQFIDYLTQDPQDRKFITDETKAVEEYSKVRFRINELEKAALKPDLGGEKLKEYIFEKQKLANKAQILQEQIKRSKAKDSGVFYQTSISFDDLDFSSYTFSKLIQTALLEYIKGHQDFKFNSIKEERRTLIKFSEKLYDTLNFEAHHLGPNRTYQARLYFKSDNDSEISSIIEDYLQHKPAEGTSGDVFLRKWLKEFGLGEMVVVESVENLANKVSIIRNGRKTSLADMGFGAGQLLTTLLKVVTVISANGINKSGKSSYILIEEPEANLHPKLQSLLADFFAEAASKFKIQFIIETHSEYLIRKTQVLVKEKQMDDLFKVYYFDDNGPYEVRYREDGVFMDEFGTGFFDESAALTFELL